jgi:hypothetical protein
LAAASSPPSKGSINLPKSLVSPRTTSLVQVRALPIVKKCKRLDLEPLTIADWELLEVTSGSLEMGGLLAQVCIVYSNQMLTLTTSRGAARMKVKICHDSGFSSEVTSTSILNDLGRSTVVLLVQDTEVVISPKPRSLETSGLDEVSVFRLTAGRGDLSIAMDEFASRSGRKQYSYVSVPPGCIYLRDDATIDRDALVWIAKGGKGSSKKQKQVLGRILVSPLIPKNCAGMYVSLFEGIL